jgi:bifunctional non-homologous end joining protein LigD
MLPRIQPINPTKIAAPFDDPDWVFELKHDGFRAVAYIENGACRLISRKQIQYKSFAGLSKVLAGLQVRDAILDGEIVSLDKFGPEPIPGTYAQAATGCDLLRL